ncbi:MAG TPA: aerobic carbon-monoxide dehydrogenase large subunit [Solirubrobacteraceae bacterium]|nr:aerobic carbon-monoxide dehydrogenase large subunit [Solirubrobacteraceae bacterium]
MTTRMFGERVERHEDDRLLLGQGRYTDDFESDAAHAAFVRSQHAHARIVDIDVAGALDVDGVYAVYTYDDLDGTFAEPLPLIIPHEAIADGRTQYALARDEVRYVGETIAMVVARDRYIAEDAADAIVVQYEPLPVVADVEAAAAPGAPVVHTGRDDNVIARVAEEHGDVDAGFANAAHTFQWRFDIERSAATPLEARGVVARFGEDGSLLVHDSTQAPTGIRNGLSRLFDLDLDRVNVVAPDVGGGFGVKVIQFYPEEVMVPLAARRLGMAVKWTEDRREHFVGSTHERKQVHHVRVGADGDGRIVAFETSFLHDSGAYCPYGLIIPIISAAQLPGPYRLDNYRYDFTALFTNCVATSPYRGAGRPHGAFVMERVMDRLAAELKLDRAEIRRRNLIGPDEFPYDVGVTFQDGGPTVYDSGDYPTGLERLLEEADYAGFEKRRRSARRKGRRIGLGIAAYVEGTGIGPYEGAAVNVQVDGTVTVATGLSSQGQGHQTIFAQIVAAELGVPVDRIRVRTGDTRGFGWGVGTFASRTAVVSGNAVHKAAVAVRAQAAELAARVLEADPEDIEFADGRVGVVGAPAQGLPIGQLAAIANPLRYAFGEESAQAALYTRRVYASQDVPLPDGTTPGLNATEYYSPASGVYGFGIHAAEVEVDLATCEVRILRYTVGHDCGRIINPIIVEGQMYGGVAQGIGGALYERMAYDEDGQLLNASFMDFLMPYATELPEPVLFHTETPSPNNALGVKGVGEAGTIPVAAAIANAISDAIGKQVDKMPISPSELFELVHGA